MFWPRFAVLVVLSLFTVALSAGEWRGLTDENWISGSRLKAGDLRGKVVVVVEWGADCPACGDALAHVQKNIDGQRANGHPVAMLASHRRNLPREDIRAKCRRLSLECPVYQDAEFSDMPALEGLPAFSVIDRQGRILYGGGSAEDAVLAMIRAITDLKFPRKNDYKEIAE